MILDEPPRGGYFMRELLGLSGLDQMRAGIEGRTLPPPLHHLTGLRPTAIGPGTSAFAMPSTGWLASHHGVISGGVLAVLADGPLGCCIQSQLPAGTIYTTSELSMSYLRPTYPDGRDITATGRVIHQSRTLALSDAVVLDGDGREVAHATSRCFIFPRTDAPPAPPDELPVLEPVGYGSPDPYQREPEGLILGERADAYDGIDLWRRYVAGEIDPPPLHHLTGARPVAVEEGSITWTMAASPWLCSPTGFVEGGFLAYLADTAIVTASATLTPAGTATAAIDVTVKFLRPVAPDGRLLTAVGRVVNHGRSLSVGSAEIRDAEGKLVIIALGSSLLLPGRSLARPPEPDR